MIDIKIPLKDIIPVIITQIEHKLVVDASTLAKSIIKSYSGDLPKLKDDILYIFFGESKTDLFDFDEYKKEFDILEQVFGFILLR